MNGYMYTAISTGAVGTILLILAPKISSISKVRTWIIYIVGVILLGAAGYYEHLGSSASIRKEFSSFKAQLEEFKKDTSSNKIKTQIQELENDFTDWYNKFLSEKDIRKIEIEKKELAIKQRIAETNNKYRSVYAYFFESLKKHVDAANLKGQKEIRYKIPHFPKNIFSDETNHYKTTIEFKNKTIWKISVRSRGYSDYNILPVIDLAIENQEQFNKMMGRAGFQIQIDPDANSIAITEYKYKLDFYNLNVSYGLDKYKSSFDEIIGKFLEYQLLKIG
ncbi:MAG: hypothetical protein U9R38_07670 [Candidatus Margulisiibacteriota bacterium]|nr:hypothetical protein [Candidatus Margulisiibacteriota bacterium]